MDQDAGASSPHLDQGEQDQAATHAAPRALVIHEIVREEGEMAITRTPGALAWSGLAAGLSMGFSFLDPSLLHGGLAGSPWQHLIDSFGYTIGFVIVILARQQLFTESTLTAVLPVLTRQDRRRCSRRCVSGPSSWPPTWSAPGSSPPCCCRRACSARR